MAPWNRRRPEPGLTPSPEEWTEQVGPASALIAAAKVGASAPMVADPNNTGSGSNAPVPAGRVVDPRQHRARTYASRIGFIGTTYRFMAYQAARCPWVVEVSDDGVAWESLSMQPEDAPQESTDVDPSAAYAWAVMRSIQPDRGTQADMFNQMVYLDDTIGEWYLIDVSAGERIAFLVRDSQLCAPESKRNPKGPWIIQDVEGGKVSKGTARRVSADRVYRHWQEDANSPLMATSSLIGLTEDIDTYWSLIRHLKREVRSRIAMNRALWTPSEAHAETIKVGDEFVSKLNYNVAQAVAKAVNDEGDSLIESFAPFLINTPGNLSHIPTMIDMGVLGEGLLKYITDARTQVAASLPLSTSFILDSQGTDKNHWNEWLADDRDEETIRARAERCLATPTDQVFRPALRWGAANGFYRGDPELTRIGFDPSVIRRQLDNSENAKYAFEKGLIREDVARRDLHYTEAEAPDEAELAKIVGLRDRLWISSRQTEATPGALPSGDTAVPGNGTPPAELAGLASFIDDTHLLELTR